MRRLVLFDFDGTLTEKDSMLEFIRFYHGSIRLITGLVLFSPLLLFWKLKIVDSHTLKELFLSYFFGGKNEQEFKGKCIAFHSVIGTMLRREALGLIHEYKNEKATVVVVSASPEDWVEPWCNSISITCIATQLQKTGGKLTGKIEGRNCLGIEKVRRIKLQFDLSQFDEIVAYGDTPSDLPMLALANRKFYKRLV